MVIERVQKCSHGTEMKTYFLYLKWVSNAKISAQKSNFEKTDHLLGKVTEIFFSKAHQTGTRWPWLDMIWFFYSFWVVERVQKCSHGTEMKIHFLCLQWVSNAKISAQNSNFEKTDNLLGKVREFYFKTLIKQWSGDLGMIWYHFSIAFWL